jgi:RNA-directed DNA polymerase
MLPQLVDLSRPTSAEEVATTIGAPVSLFLELIDPTKKSTHYKLHRIPKRRPFGLTTHREVWECRSEEVATVHKTLARRLQPFLQTRCVFPSGISHGYVPGKSTLTNARVHAGSPLLLRVDIANFFGTISTLSVERSLVNVGIQREAACALAELCTVNGSLALGLHASPILANLSCLGLDEDLENLASAERSQVTRYADDVAFSGSNIPTMKQVITVLQQHGFTESASKCRVTKLGQAHYVTGLSISGSTPRLPRSMKRRVRQELYFAAKYGLTGHLGKRGDISIQAGVNRIDGTLRYFNGVEPSLAAKLKTHWDHILKIEDLRPAYSPRVVTRDPVTIFVDETEIMTPDGKVLAISLALLVEVGQVQAELQQVIRTHLLDPFSTGDKAILEATGLHYVDISEDLRTAAFKALEFLPIRGFIAYDMLHNQADYRATYERLVGSLLRHRLMFCDGATVSLVFEQNSNLQIQGLTDLTNDVFKTLVKENNRRPLTLPAVRFGTKLGDPCLAVADFILAAFRQYAVVGVPVSKTGQKPPGELAIKRFERLRDRIRFINALPTKKSFSRKHPFTPWPGQRPTQS